MTTDGRMMDTDREKMTTDGTDDTDGEEVTTDGTDGRMMTTDEER